MAEEKNYQDIIYTVAEGVATITINRPERMNAWREDTYYEIIEALTDAGWDKSIGVVVIEGAGGKAFGVGGDPGDKKSSRAGQGLIGVPIDAIHTLMRDIPKPVIAKVDGFAIGAATSLRRYVISQLRPIDQYSGRSDRRLDRSIPVSNSISVAHHRREASTGILVPLPPLHGAGGL